MPFRRRRRHLGAENLESRRMMAVVINEVVTLQDIEDVADWIEVYNTGPANQQLNGWSLVVQQAGTPQQTVQLPAVLLASKGYLRVNVGNILGANNPGTPQQSLLLRDAAGQPVDNTVLPLPEQIRGASYGKKPGTEDGTAQQFQFFETPTPGAVNAYLLSSSPSGIYSAPFSLSFVVRNDLPAGTNVQVRYTDDGSMPTPSHGTVYNQQQISSSKVLRFAVIVNGTVRESGIRSYLFKDGLVSNVVADRGPTLPPLVQQEVSDLNAAFDSLPSMFITVIEDGTPDVFTPIPGSPFGGNPPEVVATLELVMNQQSQFQYTGLVKTHGNSCDFADQKKTCYRFTADRVTTETDDPTRSGLEEIPYDLFPISSYPAWSNTGHNDTTIKELVLRMGNQDSFINDNPAALATYIRDSVGREIQRKMGGLVPHERPVNLYVNDRYYGLFFVSERITSDFVSSYYGGDDEHFLVRSTQTSGVENGPSARSDSFDEWAEFFDEIVSPHITVSNNVVGVTQDFHDVINDQVDVDDLLGFILTNQVMKHSEFLDGGDNWYASKEATDGLWRFHSWDIENLNASTTTHDATVNILPSHVPIVNGQQRRLVPEQRLPMVLHSLLMMTPEYKSAAEQKLLQYLPKGNVNDPMVLSLPGIRAKIDTAADEIFAAMKGEAIRYAKWGSFADWQTGLSAFRARMFFIGRSDLVLDYAARLDGLANVDFISDHVLDELDIDMLINGILAADDPQTPVVDLQYDLNGDQDVDFADLAEMVTLYVGTFFGDSNIDGIFSSTDFVTALTNGTFEDILHDTWMGGDWNGDGLFNTTDIVFVMGLGEYVST